MSTIKVNAIKNTSDVEMYLAKAWVNFNATGTLAIRSAGNVSSVTDNATGDYTVNFTTALPDANYAVSLMAQQGASGELGAAHTWNAGTYTSSAVRVRAFGSNTGNAFDPSVFCVAVLR